MPIPKGDRGGRPISAFEGISEFRDENDSQALHDAIQEAAMAASAGLTLRPGDTVDIEVTRIQIVVGNPNVKAYRVEVSRTDPNP